MRKGKSCSVGAKGETGRGESGDGKGDGKGDEIGDTNLFLLSRQSDTFFSSKKRRKRKEKEERIPLLQNISLLIYAEIIERREKLFLGKI